MRSESAPAALLPAFDRHDPLSLFPGRRVVSSGLEAVFLENRELLLRFLRARGATDAEDLLQETWFRVTNTPTGPIRNPLSYLYSTANNLMLDRARSEIGRHRREQDWASDERPSTEHSEEPSQERVLLGREQLRAVQHVLQSLGDRTDTIFRRFRLEGASQSEIASDLGISLSAVEKHLQRAYRALADLRRQADAD